MKKILLFLFICSSVFAQQTKKVANAVLNLQKENRTFISHAPLTINESTANSDYKKSVEIATILTLDLNETNQIVSEKANHIQLAIPYLDETITVLLYKVAINTEDFQVDTDKATNVTVEKGVHYRGIIKDDINSLVSFNFFNNQMSGIISNQKYQNLVVGKLNLPNNQDYIIYSDAHLKKQNSFVCATPDVLPQALPSQEQQRATTLTNRCVTMYFEMDYDMYVANGSSVNQANTWMNSVFNNVQTLYDNDEINIALKSIFVWTSPDPYIGDASWQYLNQFHELRPIFNGDLGQLIGMDSGLGGVAAVIDGLCADTNYSYSDVHFDFNTVPTFSWTVQVISHEFGHLMGSPHTHGCYWNGNGTAIDGCGPTANEIYTEGNCDIGPVPSEQVGGTIMSYCHLLDGIGINLANGFGPQPAARIAQTVDGSSCLSTDCINTCISMIETLEIDSVNSTSAIFSWADLNLENEEWEVAFGEYPFVAEDWDYQTVDFNPAMANNLTPNTYYTVYVRPACGLNTIGPAKKIIFATSDDFCAGRPFLDTGGLESNYQDSEQWTRTVMPSVPGAKIKVVFNSINIEEGYDFLLVYNGTDPYNDNALLAEITGTTTVGPFESTDESGALSFRFLADDFLNESGWDANFTCLNLGIEDNSIIDFSYYPNPVSNIISINSKNEIQGISIYSIDGKLLYENAVKQFDSNINMSNYASGTYIFKLQFEGKPATFKVMKQ